MRLSRYYLPTLKEAPKDADVKSHALLVRGGFIRKIAAGIYDFMPLGVRVLKKIEAVIREELDRANAHEVLLPAVQPAELWEESGRYVQYGPELLRFQDRKGGHFCFGPTHEEVITDLVRRDVRSYRDLPVILYQIQVKFRDEIRPRFGIMRAREFSMKDAYSFDVDDSGAHASYEAMHAAYCRIFTRCGFRFKVVEADTGAIGGSRSHEFQVLAESGEDSILTCRKCGYTANDEKAEIPPPDTLVATDCPACEPPRERVHTPNQRTVEEVTDFLGISPKQLIKTLLYVADEKLVAFLIRGDHDLNEPKAKAMLGASLLEMADEATVRRATGAPVGFAGPVGLEVPCYADWALQERGPMVTGANEEDYHHRGVVLGRDFEVREFADLRIAATGDTCPRCGTRAAYDAHRGIEVGHIFFLGTKYSETMHCTFLDENGAEQPAVMGCYGIGVSRILAAAVEQSHDEDGIIWPMPLAPFQVNVVPLNMDDAEVREVAEQLYSTLLAAGVETLLDDRPERPGAKFKDSALVGIPFQVVIGRRGLKNGVVELSRRGDQARRDLPVAEAAAEIIEQVRAAFDDHRLPPDWVYDPSA